MAFVAGAAWRLLAGLLIAVALWVWVSGCGMAGSGITPSNGNGNPPPASAEFRDVQAIFTRHCAFAPCHAPPAPVLGQDLSEGAAYQSIVNVPSQELPTMDRVEPGDPAKSYLLHKDKGTQASVGGSGEQMPLGGPYLSNQDIATIENWIRDGANP